MFEYDALHDQKHVIFAFLQNFQKPPGGFEYVVRRRMNINPILGFLVMNRLAARVAPPGDANIVIKRYFSYFSRNRHRRAQLWYRQAQGFDFLGAKRNRFF